jgi:hypothetical protein
MRNLASLREGWEEIEREERRIEERENLTVEQKFRIFLSLIDSLAPFIKKSEEFFRRDRVAYLIEIQDKLMRLDKWRERQDGNSTEPA